MVRKIDPAVKKLSPAERKKYLQNEVSLLNKQFGKDMIQFGWDKELQRISFKNDRLNEITSGGVPAGRFNIFWGSKGACKTTVCYDLVAKAQEMGQICLWVDLERSFDAKWASTMGVDVKSLLIAPRFDTAEEAMDSIIALTKKKAVDLIVIDSIQGLSPKGEQETKKGIQKSVEDDTMALLARKLSQFFRISSSGVAQSDCTVILIGQTRMDFGGFVTLEKLSGGNALEHWSSLTIHFRRGAKANAPAVSKKTGKPVKGNSPDATLAGFELVAKINKSKVGPDEMKEAKLHFIYGEGIKDITTEAGDDQQEPDKSDA